MDLRPATIPVPRSRPWAERGGHLCLLSPCFPVWTVCRQGLSTRWAQDLSAESCFECSGSFYITGIFPEAMGGLMHVTGLHYPAVDLKRRLFWQPHLFLHGLPPNGRGVSTVSQHEGAGLYSTLPCHSCAPLDTSNRAHSHGSPALVSASAPFLPVASGLQLSSHLFIWPSFVFVSLALIWLPLAQDLNASQALIYLSSHMRTHTHTCEVRKYHCSHCTDGEH